MHAVRQIMLKFRDRASILCAQMDVSESHRSVFYKHKGFAPELNSAVYQCPLAVTDITHFERYLNDIDGQRTFEEKKHGTRRGIISLITANHTREVKNIRNAKVVPAWEVINEPWDVPMGLVQAYSGGVNEKR